MLMFVLTFSDNCSRWSIKLVCVLKSVLLCCICFFVLLIYLQLLYVMLRYIYICGKAKLNFSCLEWHNADSLDKTNMSRTLRP